MNIYIFIFGAAFFDFIVVHVTRHVSPAIGCFSLLFFAFLSSLCFSCRYQVLQMEFEISEFWYFMLIVSVGKGKKRTKRGAEFLHCNFT